MWGRVLGLSIVPSVPLALVSATEQNSDKAQIYALAAFAVAGISIAVHYAATIRPVRTIEAVRSEVLHAMVLPIIEAFRDQGLKMRSNVMMPRRWWIRRYFCFVWSHAMLDQPDVGIRIPITSGVAGACYAEKRPILAGPEKLKELHPTLPKQVQPLTSDVAVILAVPVFEPPKADGNQSGRILGILSLDSRDPNAYEYLADGQNYRAVQKHMDGLAALAAKLFSA